MVDFVTPLPPPPQRGQPPAIFSALADAFLGSLPLFGQQLNLLGITATEAADIASDSALAAQLAAATATGAPGTNSTSTTSLTIGTGSKSFTTQAGKIYPAGVTVVIARTSAPSNQMIGVVQSYNSSSGAMVVSSASVSGSGTFTDWTIAVVPAGTVGIPFNTATVGDLWVGNDNQKSLTVATLMGAAIPQLITETSTVILDFTTGWNTVMPLTASRIIGKPVGSRAGMTYTFDLINNGSGLATWDACFEFGIDGTPTLSTVNGKRDRVVLSCYDATVGAPKFNCNFKRAA